MTNKKIIPAPIVFGAGINELVAIKGILSNSCNRRIKICEIGIIPALDSLVVIAFRADDYHIHPCRTTICVIAEILTPVSAGISASHRVVETLDIEKALTFAPKLNSLLEYNLFNYSILIGSFASVFRVTVCLHEFFNFSFALGCIRMGKSLCIDKIHFLDSMRGTAVAEPTDGSM